MIASKTLIDILLLFFSNIKSRKDNIVKLLIQFEPYYEDEFMLIQSYNKSKNVEAFRFNGIFFSEHKTNRMFKKEIKEKEIILNDNLLKTNINPKDFEIVKPFNCGKVRKVNYKNFIDRASDFIQDDNTIKENFLSGEKSIYIVIVYEEDLGKKHFFKVELNSKKGYSNKLYNDILYKLLETKEKEKFPVPN